MLVGHHHPVDCIAWSPKGDQIISGSVDDKLIVWDSRSGRKNSELIGHQQLVHSVAWSPVTNRIASRCLYHCFVWEASTGRRLSSISLERKSGKQALGVAWNPTGDRIVISSYDNKIQIFDAISGFLISSFEGHECTIQCVAWSPGGEYIASASCDKTAVIWDTLTGLRTATLTGHKDWVKSVAFSPDGAQVATCGDDATTILWDTSTGALIRTLDVTKDFVAERAPSFRFASVGGGDLARRSLRKNPHAAAPRKDWFNTVAWSPAGGYIVSGSNNGILYVWAASTGCPVAQLAGHGAWVAATAWAPDGARLASASGDGTVVVWEVDRRQTLAMAMALHARLGRASGLRVLTCELLRNIADYLPVHWG